MSFKEVRFDMFISYKGESGPMYKTTITELPSGQEFRRAWWANGRKKAVITRELLDRDEVAYLESFFRNMKGRLYGFRFRDWNSYLAEDAPVGVISDTSGQLQIIYSEPVTSSQEIRKITKPVLLSDVENDIGSDNYSPDITLKRNGTDWPALGNWTLDRTTGILTYASSQAGNTITWSGSYDLPVRFDEDVALFAREALDIYDWSNISLIELKQ